MRIYLLLLALLPTLVYAQVDMGLPSGLKWMHYNVDAKNETDRGLYFSWGALKRTKPRGDPYMDEDDYKRLGCDQISADLSPEQDAVHDYYPNAYSLFRMPTKEDYQELIDNCPYIWIDNYKGSGMPGLLFLSTKTGKTLFFPAGGVHFEGAMHVDLNREIGLYWTSSYKDEKYAYYFAFSSKGAKILDGPVPRYSGLNIRGVCDYACYPNAFVETKTPPEFPNGGWAALVQYIASHLKYPQEAVKKGIQGQVLLSFVIERDGTATNIEVVKSADPILDAEAVRVISSMPKWIPAKRGEYEVADQYSLPVTFRLH